MADSVSDEDRRRADEAKGLANELFKLQKYNEAIERYTEAIKLNPFNAIFYGNRSIAYLRMELFGWALEDASKAIELDKTYLKGYYRRAAANMALGKHKKAVTDYEAVSKARPNDKEARTKFIECQKIVRKLAFERAIAVEGKTSSVADDIDVSTMTVEDSYTGPRLEDKITLTFMKQLLVWFKQQKVLHKKYAYIMLLQAKQLLQSVPSLVDITVPQGKHITVCGDIHGQFYDLLNIFELNDLPSEENPYLFNGDFVDRGSFSIEVIFTLIGFKLLYPGHFFMARGNHETIDMNEVYGFRGECKHKYSLQMADLFTEIFNWLPLSHLINQKVFVTHGGLFDSDEVNLDDIRQTDRNRQPPQSGIMCGLLWSDPQPENGRATSKRGTGIQFGPDITEKFLQRNNLDLVIRSHEVKPEGYEVSHNGRCVTVFSAPNYCDQMGNKGAFIRLQAPTLKPEFTTYEAVAHPSVRPMAYASPLFSMLM